MTPPRQLSGRPYDPGYDGQWAQKSLDIRVDGVLVKDVIRYDIDEGWLDLYAVDAEGKPIIVDDAFSTERRHGVVTVALKTD